MKRGAGSTSVRKSSTGCQVVSCMADGLWCAVRRYSTRALLYAALRCLWHEVHDDERSNRYESSCAASG
eukprot:1709405-Prymnesium_polylepis.1